MQSQIVQLACVRVTVGQCSVTVRRVSVCPSYCPVSQSGMLNLYTKCLDALITDLFVLAS